MTVVQDSARRQVTLGGELARGGEGVVYTVAGRTDVVAKLYSPAPREGAEDKLRWMLAHPPKDPGRGHGQPSIAWPVETLFDGNRRFLGYVMPYVREAVPLLMVFNPRLREQTLPQLGRRYLYRAARNLAAALAALHEEGYVVGDLNESNVLLTPSALATIIDADSFQVQEPRQGRIIVYSCPVGKPEYTAPELQGRTFAQTLRRPEHDVFALAVLVFQLLMEGNHPFRARWLGRAETPPLADRISQGLYPYSGASPLVEPPPAAPPLTGLPPDIGELFRRCFVEGHQFPGRRPTATEWKQALENAEQQLVTCSQGHAYPAHLRTCPYCGTAKRARPARPARPKVTEAERRPPPRTAPPPPPAPPPVQSAGRSGPPRAAVQADRLRRLAGQLLPFVIASAGSRGARRGPLWARMAQAWLGQSLSTGPAGPGGVTVACPRCGLLNDTHDIYCQNCTSQLSSDRACFRCGRAMPANTRYCPHCGAVA